MFNKLRRIAYVCVYAYVYVCVYIYRYMYVYIFYYWQTFFNTLKLLPSYEKSSLHIKIQPQTSTKINNELVYYKNKYILFSQHCMN